MSKKPTPAQLHCNRWLGPRYDKPLPTRKDPALVAIHKRDLVLFELARDRALRETWECVAIWRDNTVAGLRVALCEAIGNAWLEGRK